MQDTEKSKFFISENFIYVTQNFDKNVAGNINTKCKIA